MSETNKEFYDLLNSLTTLATFKLTLTDGKEYTFKQLSTSQLKELIKTVVDSPLTQSVYNNTISKVMKESLISEEGVEEPLFNIVDRLLFAIETRIQSISSTVTVEKNDKTLKVDLTNNKKKLVDSLASSPNLFANQEVTEKSITIAYGLPLIVTENQINEELYKNIDLNVESQNDFRKILGETFINEIAKTIRTITIQDKVLDLSTVTFKSRLKTIESLPASLINNVIEYIEKYRKILDESLVVEENISVPIDGTLFSLR